MCVCVSVCLRLPLPASGRAQQCTRSEGARHSSPGGGQRNRPSPSPFASAPFSNDEFESMFVWNSYLTRSMRMVLGNPRWLVALVHGYWDQKRVSGEEMAAGGSRLCVCAGGGSGGTEGGATR